MRMLRLPPSARWNEWDTRSNQVPGRYGHPASFASTPPVCSMRQATREPDVMLRRFESCGSEEQCDSSNSDSLPRLVVMSGCVGSRYDMGCDRTDSRSKPSSPEPQRVRGDREAIHQTALPELSRSGKGEGRVSDRSDWDGLLGRDSCRSLEGNHRPDQRGRNASEGKSSARRSASRGLRELGQ